MDEAAGVVVIVAVCAGALVEAGCVDWAAVCAGLLEETAGAVVLAAVCAGVLEEAAGVVVLAAVCAGALEEAGWVVDRAVVEEPVAVCVLPVEALAVEGWEDALPVWGELGTAAVLGLVALTIVSGFLPALFT